MAVLFDCPLAFRLESPTSRLRFPVSSGFDLPLASGVVSRRQLWRTNAQFCPVANTLVFPGDLFLLLVQGFCGVFCQGSGDSQGYHGSDAGLSAVLAILL